MKSTIRQNVFETNSSSMHSIVVAKNNQLNDYTLNHNTFDYKWHEDDFCFGRYPFQILMTAEDKTRYVIASYCCWKSEDYCKDFVEQLIKDIKKVLPNFKEIILPKTVTVYGTAEDGKEYELYEWDDDDFIDEDHFYIYRNNKKLLVDANTRRWEETPFYGDVDHQSAGLIDSFITKHNISLTDFIFDNQYIVIIDGDEYNIFGDMEEAGLISKNNIKEHFGWNEY